MWNSEYATKDLLKEYISYYRSSHRCCSVRKGVACNFIQKQTLAQVFSCEFYEISKNTFLQNNSGGCFWMLRFPSRFSKQEMLHMLTIAVRKIVHACIRNLNSQISKFSKNAFHKEKIWILFEVFFILFSERKNSRLYLCFIIRTCK